MCSRYTSFTMLLAAPSIIPAYAAERHSHCTNMLVGSTPRIGLTYSGALKNTSHLGQKDARDKRARGNDGVLRNCSTGIMLQE